MQNDKLINVSGATPRKSGSYSIEFHEDNHYAHIKRANNDGTADYFAFNQAGPTASNRFENYSDSGAATYTALANADTPVILDGQGQFDDRRFSPKWLDHDLYNTSTGRIDLSGVPIGTLVHITYDLELVPSSSNEEVHIFFKFAAFGGYELYVQDSPMRQQSITHHYSGTKTFFVFNEDVQNAGVQLVVNASCDTQIIPNFIMIALL